MSESATQHVAIEAKRVTMRNKRWLGSALGWTTAFLGLLPLIVIMVAALLFPGGGKPWWAPYLSLSWLGALGTGIGALSARAPWANQAAVSVEDDAITFTAEPQVANGNRQVPLDEIVHGTVIPGFGARLEKKDGGTIDVEVASTRDAEQLIAACDLPPPERRFATSFNASWLSAVIAMLGVLGLIVCAMKMAPSPTALTPVDAAVWMAMAASIFGGAYFGTRPPRVEVGADGVNLRTMTGSRFVGFEDLASVTLDDTKLTLELHDGDPVEIKAAKGNEAQQRALRHRIEMGIAAHADAPQAPVRLALLDRKQRPMAQWRDELDQAVNDDTGYRRQPLSRDDLEAILAAPNTSAERRIGAALALQALDGEDASPRIRIAAEACAEHQARDALLRIAEQEYEHRAIEQALEASAQLEARAG